MLCWFLDYQYGVRLATNIDGKVLITFNGRNEHDRSKFVEDLKEAILEVREQKYSAHFQHMIYFDMSLKQYIGFKEIFFKKNFFEI